MRTSAATSNATSADPRRAHILLLICAGVLLCLPCLVLGFPQRTNDAMFHEVWSRHFALQLWSGELYPRWMSGMNGGLGSPTFFFYPPLPAFVAALLAPLVGDTWRALGISAAIAVCASGCAAYLWLRSSVSPRAALVAGAMYMAMPYHLATDLYQRGALAEGWAFVWMPLLLLFARHAAGSKGALLGLCVSYAMLLLSHMVSALLFSPFLLAYALASTWGAPHQARSLARIGAAIALGIGLSAAYFVPALGLLKHVSSASLSGGFLDYSNNFLMQRSPLGSEYTRTVLKISGITLATLIPAVAAWILASKSREGATSSTSTWRRESLFHLATLGACLFLMTRLSSFVWEALPRLQMVQFPWRLNTVACVSSAALLALAIERLIHRSEQNRRSQLAMRGVLGLTLVAWAALTVPQIRSCFLPKTGRDAQNARDRQRFSIDAPEYKPRGASTAQAVAPERELWVMSQRNAAEGSEVRAIVEGQNARVSVTSRSAREIVLDVQAPRGAKIIVTQLYFPGWEARLESSGTTIPVSPSARGLVQISVPQSTRGAVNLRLSRTPSEKLGHRISLFSLAALALAAIFLRRARGREHTV